MKFLPCGLNILFIKKLLSSFRFIYFHCYNIKLLWFVLLYSSIMDSILYDYLFLFLIFHISFIILIFYNIFHLISFFGIKSLLVYSLKWLWEMIRWRKLAIKVFSMLFLLFLSLLLEILFLLGVVEFTENWVIIMGIPILAGNFCLL